MQDYTHFHEVFKPEWGSPYTDPTFNKDVDVYRKSLNGVLFIDRVLKALGITKRKSTCDGSCMHRALSDLFLSL